MVFLKKDFIYLYLEREEERERNTDVKEKHRLVALHVPHPLGTWPAPQACVLTGNQTSNLLVNRPALNPLSHNSQGSGEC